MFVLLRFFVSLYFWYFVDKVSS